MFFYRMALAFFMVIASASGFEAQVRMCSADAITQGLTLEPVEQCPGTAAKSFYHDGLQKGQWAQATYKFDPPHDGCYLIEEKHPQLQQCRASGNTKVHVNYDVGLSATGTVDQTANGGQWTFVAMLPFYAGHEAKLTLSNEDTEVGTLTIFDQVRFTWSGKSCLNSDSHPRRAQIRMTLDFQTIANRQNEFGSALKAKLAYWAEVPERALYLTDLRSGSIIAEFLVMPSVVDHPSTDDFSPEQIIERLRGAVADHIGDICGLPMVMQTLFGDEKPDIAHYYLNGCNVEFKDLGFAQQILTPVTKQMQQHKKEDEDTAEGFDAVIIYVTVCIAALGLMSCMSALYIYQIRKSKKVVAAQTNQKNGGAYEVQMDAKFDSVVVEAKTETEKPAEEKKPADDENTSTLCPSDAQSDASGNAENALGTVKALSNQEL